MRPCIATKKDGQPCNGGAQKGYEVCGPHLTWKEPKKNEKKKKRTPPTEFGPLLTARNLAYEYEGDFEFMLEMRRKARSGTWLPTRKQADAIYRCTRTSNESIDSLVNSF